MVKFDLIFPQISTGGFMQFWSNDYSGPIFEQYMNNSYIARYNSRHVRHCKPILCDLLKMAFVQTVSNALEMSTYETSTLLFSKALTIVFCKIIAECTHACPLRQPSCNSEMILFLSIQDLILLRMFTSKSLLGFAGRDNPL